MRLALEERVGGASQRYLKRLSDALFVLARFENLEGGYADVIWDSRA